MVGQKKLVRKAEPPSKPTEDRNSQSVFLRPPIEAKKSLWGLRGKTIWDWLPILGALLVPVVIAAGTWAITWQQGKIEDQRAEAERKLAEQRAQDEALQAYLDQMSQLLRAEDLRNSEEGSEPRTLARARTLTVLGRLDSSRKGRLLQFLYEAKLIDKREPIVELTGADASDADLSRTLLGGADLKGVDLSGAGLSRAVLVEADLSCSPQCIGG
jgi:Pentapeptide repeats (8 copies)